MRTILIANAKGGCGKTTLATNLASALAANGRRVALADADPQRSSITWLARRPADAPKIHAIDGAALVSAGAAERRRRMAVGGIAWRRALWTAARREARRLGVDWLIVDAPAGDTMTRGGQLGLAAQVDLVVAPVAPSIFDEHASRRFLALIEGAPAIRCGDADLLVVANRVRRKRRPGRLEGRLEEAARRQYARLGVEPAAEIAERSAYPLLASMGLGLFDPASAEVAPRKTARLKQDWTPLLRAVGLPTAPVPA